MDTASAVAAREWVGANVRGGVLNVAGPRASKHPSVYNTARAFLLAAALPQENEGGASIPP
jgi:hypothetical protein